MLNSRRHLLRDHVDVVLDDHTGRVLPAGRSGAPDEDVAHRIRLIFEAPLCREVLEEIAHRLLVARGARDACELEEVGPHRAPLLLGACGGQKER